jgi:hypothetical protein
MHFTAAGMAAAVAAGKVASAGGGGGGGSSVGARERGQGGFRFQEDVKKERTLHIQLDIGKKRFGDYVVDAIEEAADRDNPGRNRVKVI